MIMYCIYIRFLMIVYDNSLHLVIIFMLHYFWIIVELSRFKVPQGGRLFRKALQKEKNWMKLTRKVMK